jgi:hypothetical protein
MTLTITPKRVAGILALGATILVLAHFAGWVYAVSTSGPHNWRLFNLDREANIPTWYSTALLLLSSLALGLISLATWGRERFAGYWLGLAVIFAYLSADEAAMLHEELSHPLRILIPLPAPVRKRAWVVAGVVALVVFFLVYRRFLQALPAITRRRFVLAGMMYVTGAMVLEVVSGAVKYELGSKASFSYQLTAMGEEGLEMYGVTLFIYALLSYLSAQDGKLRITLAMPARDAGSR